MRERGFILWFVVIVVLVALLNLDGRPSRALAAVREAHTLPSAARQHRFGELAAELQLAHLAVFLQRTVR